MASRDGAAPACEGHVDKSCSWLNVGVLGIQEFTLDLTGLFAAWVLVPGQQRAFTKRSGALGSGCNSGLC